MKLISESCAIEKLRNIRSEFAAEIRQVYEHKAKPCYLCESPGICCRDEHFVNVRITRLEATAIVRRLDELSDEKRDEVFGRVMAAIKKYNLAEPGDSFLKTYACPLFEKGIGCLVHNTAKPLPCIAHACYENEADLPPSDLLDDREQRVADLDRKVYGKALMPLPLPVALARNRAERPQASDNEPKLSISTAHRPRSSE
jgi:hypothetical protein